MYVQTGMARPIAFSLMVRKLTLAHIPGANFILARKCSLGKEILAIGLTAELTRFASTELLVVLIGFLPLAAIKVHQAHFIALVPKRQTPDLAAPDLHLPYKYSKGKSRQIPSFLPTA